LLSLAGFIIPLSTPFLLSKYPLPRGLRLLTDAEEVMHFSPLSPLFGFLPSDIDFLSPTVFRAPGSSIPLRFIFADGVPYSVESQLIMLEHPFPCTFFHGEQEIRPSWLMPLPAHDRSSFFYGPEKFPGFFNPLYWRNMIRGCRLISPEF